MRYDKKYSGKDYDELKELRVKSRGQEKVVLNLLLTEKHYSS